MGYKDQLKGMFGLTIGTTLGVAALKGLGSIGGKAKSLAETGVGVGILGFGASMANKMFKWK